MQAKITSKGQVTVPKAVRDRFHLSPGDKIEFLIEEDGTLRVIPVTATLRELKGMVPKLDRIVSLIEMEDAIVEGAKKRGIGIDEMTAIIVRQDRFEVVGKGHVYIFNPREWSDTTKPFYHTLSHGNRYDLKARKTIQEGRK